MSMLKRISIRYLPFADAASDELPLASCCASACSRCRSAWPR
jgi:hypothetical protein